MSTDIRFLYVTTTNSENAKHLARQLLQDKLIACANIIPQMEALYWWDGKIEEGSESILVLKTTQNLVEAVRTKLKQIHPYQTPCIAEIQVDSLNIEYLNWIHQSIS